MITPEIMQALMAGYGKPAASQAAMPFPALALPNLQAAGGYFSLPHPLGAPGQMSWMPPQVTPKPAKPVAAALPAVAPVQKFNWRGEPIGTGTAGSVGEHDRSGRHGQGGGPGGIGNNGQAGRAGF